ncbi:MAG: type II and III secretion system protein [Luteolibacter sp.]|nr:type II and III secretion system protein [Luteolibacter sp.]
MLVSGAAPEVSELATRERSRRGAAIEEAQELLRKGDEAYQAGRYAESVEAYAGARELIPQAPVSSELRAAATRRYAQAAVEHARLLSRKGDVPGAKAAVDKALSEDVAPNDPGALAFRAQLDDPIRNNPALTAPHAKDVDSVRKLLSTAEGAYNLGKFAAAIGYYEDVLRIDPTNQAARRGMETVAAAKNGYQKSASDHARAEMLGQVDAAWETQITAPDLGVGPADPGGFNGGERDITIATKLERIIISSIALDQASIDEAVDFIRVKAVESDTLELDPARKGVNITVNLGPTESETARGIRARRFDLRLSQVPLSTVLKYLAEITQTSFSTDEFAVVIRPAGFSSNEMITRSYRVPPDFISNLSAGAEVSGAAEDPFATATPAGGGLLTTRLSAQEALAKQGVSFPEGASANYIPSTNTLRVINTATNLDFISQIVDTMTNTEPVMVAVRVTMISTEQSNLEELGFDWLLNPLPLNSSDSIFGAGGTVGNTPGRTAADFSTAMPGITGDPTTIVNPGVMTNGLRSGDQAINSNSIDGLIANPTRAAQSSSVAPGIMSLTGLFTDGDVQMIMRGLNQKKNVDIMAQPSTVTRSGQASTVQIIREFIYPTEYEPPELPNTVGLTGGGSFPVTPATPTAFETKDLGITLEVLPVADSSRHYVDITINPSFTNFDGFVNYGSPINASTTGLLGPESVQITENTILMPIFSNRKAATQLTVADGATIAIGGLMGQSIQIVEDKVPVLGDIPWIGRLFSSTAKQPRSTAIVFLVHVELLDPTGRPYRDR